MLMLLAWAFRHFSSWLILLELTLVASDWSLGSSIGLECVDSPLLESSVGEWCIGFFSFPIEATGLGVFFLQSSSTNVATVNLKDSIVYC